MSPLLEVEGLTKHFAVRRGVLRRVVGRIEAVNDVSLTLRAGETLAVVGESGCGKSTLGRTILGLIPATAGRVRLSGEEVLGLPPAEMRRMRRRMQIIFQDPFGSLNPRMTVAETLAEPLLLHGIAARDDVGDRVADLLRTCGLAPYHAPRLPHEFSGGQRQRVGIARALATRPELIVCDEPVSALDVSVQAQILNLLAGLQRRMGLSYLFISHDLAVVRHVAARVAVIYLGRIVEEAPAAALFAAPRHPYTRALLAAAPRPDPGHGAGHAPVTGDAPSALAPPPGCAFHPRCPRARERCRTERPALRPLGPARVACHYPEEDAAAAAASRRPSDALRRRIEVLRRAGEARAGEDA
jgi:oligopeptide/dipeptide ABC transporter ATP-binding protein